MDAERRLKLLGNLFYVLAVLGIIASVAMLFIVMRGAADLQGKMITTIVAGLSGCLFLVGLYASLGWAIHHRKWHHYCIVISGLLFLNFPFGTALGVFSLITLLNPEIRRLFEEQAQNEIGRTCSWTRSRGGLNNLSNDLR